MTTQVKKTTSQRRKGGATAVAPPIGHREQILKAALVLLTKGGRDALTTRAVANAAGIQPPILYRLFSHKAGLLDAVAEYGFGVYMAKKPLVTTEDPVGALRAGWKLHVQFGLTHPELYLLMYADPRLEANEMSAPRASERAHRMLQEHMRRVAAAGRLRVSEERGAHLFHAAACGIAITLMGMTGDQRDMSLSEIACDAALAAIVTDQSNSPAPTASTAATTLRAFVTVMRQAHRSASNVFSEAETSLLVEWLDRLSKG